MDIKSSSPHDHNSVHDFIAELTPHRSLGRTGFIVLMAIVSISSFVSGILFLIVGAWPVLVFFCVDVFLVWLAFHLNYRAGNTKERISVGRGELKVEKFDPAGRVSEYLFNPFWTRFEVSRHDQIGITSMQLKSKDATLAIGSFLNPGDRETFACEFGAALSRAKR